MLENKYQWLDALCRAASPPPPADVDLDEVPTWPGAYVRAVGLAITTWMAPPIDDGYCSASVASIASRSDCSERQVRRVLDALEYFGCIDRTQNTHSRTAVIRLRPDAFGWRLPKQGELLDDGGNDGATAGADPAHQSGQAAHQSGQAAHQSGQAACQSGYSDWCAYKDHQEHHQEHHHEDRQQVALAGELATAFEDVGRGDVGEEDLERVAAAAENAPPGYGAHRVRHVGRRVLDARASMLARLVVEDLKARRWVCDRDYWRKVDEQARLQRLADQETRWDDEPEQQEFAPTSLPPPRPQPVEQHHVNVTEQLAAMRAALRLD